MSEAAAEATGEPAGTEQQAQATGAAATETKPAEATQAQAPEWDGKVESLPPAAQKIINDLRKEDGDERIAKKTLDAIQKALNPEAGEEKPDPVKLAKLLAERDTDAKQAKTELAVYKTANKAGADADALLDSRSFLAKLKDIDPSNTKAITKAIEDAVKENPKLALVRAASASGSNFSGGSGEGAITQASFDAMTPSEKNALYNTNPAAYRKFSGR